MKNTKTLILDRKTVKGLVDIKDAVKGVEQAFKLYGEGKVQMPPKPYIYLDKYGGDFRAMPAYVECLESCAIKWVNVYPQNKRKALPTVMALIILSNPKNGLPLCIMDATYVTALRTGAAGAVAAKYLANKESKVVGMIGCGQQARTQFAALVSVLKIKGVRIWGLKRSEAESFKKDISKLGKYNIDILSSVKETVSGSDIIITTTPSRKPLVKLEWLKEGAHINAIGADAKGKQELDVKVLKKARVVVDSWEQASHSGEINVPIRKKEFTKKDIYADIGEIVSGKKKGRTSKKDLTVFDSTGLAIQDVAVADVIYKRARKRKKGKYIDFLT